MSGQDVGEGASECVRLDSLRKAIQTNRFSFPSQVPIFECQHRADIQWRVVELYFVLGWSCTRIGRRYKVTSARIQQLLRGWVSRAMTLGYVQEIPAEDTYAVRVVRAWQKSPVPDVSAVPLMPPPEVLASAATVETAKTT